MPRLSGTKLSSFENGMMVGHKMRYDNHGWLDVDKIENNKLIKKNRRPGDGLASSGEACLYRQKINNRKKYKRRTIIKAQSVKKKEERGEKTLGNIMMWVRVRGIMRHSDLLEGRKQNFLDVKRGLPIRKQKESYRNSSCY